tara:strand:- start:3035 stop:3331 length:297 start_codon:yes stop_codon:yes gene_type:complete
LIISIFFWGCVNHQSSELLIPREDLRDIIIDLHKFQLDVSLNSFNGDTISVLDSLLINKEVKKELYKNTIFFYSENPKLMLSILNEVQDSLLVSTSGF